MVFRADALQQVTKWLIQLVRAKNGVLLVRLHVLFTEGCHAGKAGLGCFCCHTGVAQYDQLLHDDGFLLGQAWLTLTGLHFERFHNGAEDCVFLQFGFCGKVGPTLRAAVQRIFPSG